jgi:hypothetical protein
MIEQSELLQWSVSNAAAVQVSTPTHHKFKIIFRLNFFICCVFSSYMYSHGSEVHVYVTL